MKHSRIFLLTLILIVLTGSSVFAQNMMQLDFNDEAMNQVIKSEQAPLKQEERITSTSDYQVGVDDILDINVIKPEPMLNTVTVAPDGSITFPYIGNVQVEGLGLSQIQEIIQKRLADGYMEYPMISVSLKATRSKKFIIYGQVNRPGAYPAEENMSLLHAITVAGGFISPGSTGEIKLIRAKKDDQASEVIELDIAAILDGSKQNMIVYPGDTIVVSVDRFFIYGQVNRPGAFPLEGNITLLNAISLAGGFIEAGSTGKVKLFRTKDTGGQFKVIETDIKSILKSALQNVTVQAGDTIVVSADKFFVSGEVNRPGAFPVEEDMTLLQAITVAGGFLKSGSIGKVKLLRQNGKEEQSEVFESDIKDVLGGKSQKVKVLPGDSIVVSADKFFISGQVLRPGEYPVEENMTLLRAITLAGGFTDSGAAGSVKLMRPKAESSAFDVIQTDITSILSGTSQNAVVLPGDTIVVSADKFFVYGEVNRPGMYPLETNTTTLTAVAMAGGFSKFGSASRVYIKRMDKNLGEYETIKVDINKVLSGKPSGDAYLKPGDIVVVTEGLF